MLSIKRILAVAIGAAAVGLFQSQAPTMRAQTDANITVNPALFQGLRERLRPSTRPKEERAPTPAE